MNRFWIFFFSCSFSFPLIASHSFIKAQEDLSIANTHIRMTAGEDSSSEISPCPCCGFLTMSEPTRDTNKICPVCGWQDDEVQYNDPDYKCGTNHESLNQARENYAQFGAKNKQALARVRSPRPDEIP